MLQFKLAKLKLEVLKSDFQQSAQKKDINIDKLAINWQNFSPNASGT